MLHGQSYDSAGAMSGKVKGASAHINSQYPKALCVPLCIPSIELCITKSCSGHEISSMIDTVSCIARLFNKMTALPEQVDNRHTSN